MTNFIVDVQYKKILDSNGYSLPMILKKAKLPPDIFDFEPVTMKKNQYYNFCNALGEVLSDDALIKLATKEKVRIPHCFNTCSLNLTKGCQTWSLMSLYPAKFVWYFLRFYQAEIQVLMKLPKNLTCQNATFKENFKKEIQVFKNSLTP